MKRRKTIVESTEKVIKIIIPSYRFIPLTIFLGLFLIVWADFEILAIKMAIVGSRAPFVFMVIWISVWTLAGVFALYSLLWQIFGKEVIEIEKDKILYTISIPGYERSKEYEISGPERIRLRYKRTSVFSLEFGAEYWGLYGGTIHFDSNKTRGRFGLYLYEDEAKEIIERIKKYIERL